MRFLSVFVFSVGLLLSVNSTMAQAFNCQDKDTEEETNKCALAEVQNEDKKLNVVFQRAITLMKITDRELRIKQDGAEKLLRQAQKSWVSFRDKNCAAEGFLFHGGGMEPYIYNSCRAKLIRARNKNLELLLEGNE